MTAVLEEMKNSCSPDLLDRLTTQFRIGDKP